MRYLTSLFLLLTLLGVHAAQPTANTPISGMSIANTLQTNAWIPIIQPLPGRTTNDNFRISPATLFAYLSTNGFPSTIVISNLVIGDWGLVITNASPVAAPYWHNTLWVNATNSRLWIWDSVGLTWIAVDPSLSSGQYTVPTVADLRLIVDTGVLQWASVWGNLVPGDGQGRRYWWNAGDTSTDDGISIIKPDSTAVGDPGRWNEE